ncbi:hypothetical protein D3C71_1641590 [compost metagenome]
MASRMARPAGKMVRRSGLTPSKSILSTSPSLNSLRLTHARPSALTSPLPRPLALIAAPMARMVPDEPMASSQVRRCSAFSMLISSRRAAV